jgi:hypothetical protein
MYELKTKLNDASVNDFLNSIQDDKKREDAFKVLDLFTEVTGQEPKMWGSSIIGFGTYKYVNGSNKEVEWMTTGFSPRKQNLTLYIMPGFSTYQKYMAKIGKHKTGKSCLYINKLEDIDLNVIRDLIKMSVDDIRKKYGA